MAVEATINERVFAKVHSGALNLATAPTFVAGDGLLYNTARFTPRKNDSVSPAKSGTRDELLTRSGRWTVDWALEFDWFPSGTLGIASDYTELLKALMGASDTNSLATTIASGSSTTGATLTAVTGLAVGDVVVVTLTDGTRVPTRIKTLVGSAVTWDALPSDPGVGAAVVSGVTYTLTAAKGQALDVGKTDVVAANPDAVTGAVVDTATINLLDAGPPTISLSGPAARYHGSGVTVPGSISTAVAEISGLTGGFYVAGAAFIANAVRLSLANRYTMLQRGLGQQWARDYVATDVRQMRVTVEYDREDATLYTAALNSTDVVLSVIVGNANGKMVGAILPKVRFEFPEEGDQGGVGVATASGVAYGTSGNDSVYLFEA